MLLFGLLLLTAFMAAESNDYYEEVTDQLVQVIVQEGKVKSLELRQETEDVRIRQMAVSTKKVSSFGKNYTLLDLHARTITGFEDSWWKVENYTFEVLDLSYNRIAEITSAMLNDLPEYVKSVDLPGNVIEHLRNGVIVNQNLISLNLANNAIREIENKALENLDRLKFLYLQENFLHSTTFAAALPGLETLHLNRNAITEIPAHTFVWLDSLQYLYLAHNKITEIQQHTFDGLVDLITLNLSDNPIERVDNRAFASTPLLKKIVLDDERGINLTDVDFSQLSVKNKIFIITSA